MRTRLALTAAAVTTIISGGHLTVGRSAEGGARFEVTFGPPPTRR